MPPPIMPRPMNPIFISAFSNQSSQETSNVSRIAVRHGSCVTDRHYSKLGTRNSKLETRNSELETRNSSNESRVTLFLPPFARQAGLLAEVRLAAQPQHLGARRVA